MSNRLVNSPFLGGGDGGGGNSDGMMSYLGFISGNADMVNAAFGINNEEHVTGVGKALAMYAWYNGEVAEFTELQKCDTVNDIMLSEDAMLEVIPNEELFPFCLNSEFFATKLEGRAPMVDKIYLFKDGASDYIDLSGFTIDSDNRLIFEFYAEAGKTDSSVHINTNNLPLIATPLSIDGVYKYLRIKYDVTHVYSDRSANKNMLFTVNGTDWLNISCGGTGSDKIASTSLGQMPLLQDELTSIAISLTLQNVSGGSATSMRLNVAIKEIWFE